MDYAFSLGEHLPEARRASLSDPPFTPQQPAMLLPGQSLLRAALKRDLFLSYPYESMEPFLQMVARRPMRRTFCPSASRSTGWPARPSSWTISAPPPKTART